MVQRIPGGPGHRPRRELIHLFAWRNRYPCMASRPTLHSWVAQAGRYSICSRNGSMVRGFWRGRRRNWVSRGGRGWRSPGSPGPVRTWAAVRSCSAIRRPRPMLGSPHMSCDSTTTECVAVIPLWSGSEVRTPCCQACARRALVADRSGTKRSARPHRPCRGHPPQRTAPGCVRRQ